MAASITSNLFGFDISTVPEIDFCVKDASVIESDVIGNYQDLFYLATQIKKTLGRADPVRLFLLTVIYQLVVQRSIVDSTGKENLLKYSHGADLDNIGAKWGLRGGRLQATSAFTTLRFTLSALLTSDSVIPIGTIVQTNSGQKFETTVEGIIAAGLLYVDIAARAVDSGELANGLVAGQITALTSWSAPFLVTVSNTTTTSGGTDIELDEHLRARIWMASESFSVAGPKGAYQYWAASANANIMDVSVWSDEAHAGQVYIYPLMTGGRLPTTDECLEVYNICNADDIRPLTDQVFVQAPTVVPYTPTVTYFIRSSDAAFSNDIQLKCEQAYTDYIYWQRTKIGRDINPSKCDQMLVDAGAKRTNIPGSTAFVFATVNDQSVANESLVAELLYGGLEED